MNQPFVFGWHDDAMYVQAFPVLEDDEREHPKAADALLNAAISDEMWQKVKQHNAAVDLELVNAHGRAAARHRDAGVEAQAHARQAFIAAARHVENRVPEGATWNGKEELLVTAEEFEATRTGMPRRRSRRGSRRRRTPPRRPPAAHRPGRTDERRWSSRRERKKNLSRPKKAFFDLLTVSAFFAAALLYRPLEPAAMPARI